MQRYSGKKGLVYEYKVITDTFATAGLWSFCVYLTPD